MHGHDLRAFAHSHAFAEEGRQQRERALMAVTLLTMATMAGELFAGWWAGSLALTADGWHMGTHALALGGAVLAYRLSQRASVGRGGAPGKPGFAFGGWKIEVLSAYTSGLVLMAVAVWLAWEGVEALLRPRPVAYAEALAVAVIGLIVNVASVWLLMRGAGPRPESGAKQSHEAHVHNEQDVREMAHAHSDGRSHGHSHGDRHGHSHGDGHGHSHAAHHHGDHNFSAAYMHVLADAFTSLLAIGALAGGVLWGLAWLDPAVALLGSAVIARWAWGVLASSGRALVDATEDPALAASIRSVIEADGDAEVADLHVWQVGAQAWCAALSVVADAPLPAASYRERLAQLEPLRHVTVEVHRCPSAPSPA
ncbi:MAG TPA: cation diffusion facilitator family transporter [Rubrivivax sp.]|nr:cation diffusion facilitator family transporter [Rubrivivax sp.]